MMIEPLLSNLSLQDSAEPRSASRTPDVGAKPSHAATAAARARNLGIESGTTDSVNPNSRTSPSLSRGDEARSANVLPNSNNRAASSSPSARHAYRSPQSGPIHLHHPYTSGPDVSLMQQYLSISPTALVFPTDGNMTTYAPHLYVGPSSPYYLATASTSPPDAYHRAGVGAATAVYMPSPASISAASPPMTTIASPTLPMTSTTRPSVVTGVPFVPTVTPSGWTPDHAKAIASSCHRPEFGAPAHWIIEQLEAGMVIHRLGRCKYFDVVKGFGFILDDNIAELGGRDVFVHFTGITMKAGFRCLSPGEKVEYDLVRAAGGGYQALNVTGAFGRPLIGLTADQYAHHAKGDFVGDRKRNDLNEMTSPKPSLQGYPVADSYPPSWPQEAYPNQHPSYASYRVDPMSRHTQQQDQHQHQQHYHNQPQHHHHSDQQQQHQQHHHHPLRSPPLQPHHGSLAPGKAAGGAGTRAASNFWSSTKHRNVLPYFAFSENVRPSVESVGPRCADYAPLFTSTTGATQGDTNGAVDVNDDGDTKKGDAPETTVQDNSVSVKEEQAENQAAREVEQSEKKREDEQGSRSSPSSPTAQHQ